MKITKSNLVKMTITGAPALDPINVFLEDHGPGAGEITIKCYGQSWTAYWGSMGAGNSIARFFCACDTGYIIGRLAPHLHSNKYDPEATASHLHAEIIRRRKDRYADRAEALDKGQARELYDLVSERGFADSAWGDADIFQKVYGEEWWHSVKEDAPNPDYDYLARIVLAVQGALRHDAQPLAA